MNTFGLPSGTTCPGATPACLAVCYAARLEAYFSAAAAVLQRNYETLQECGDDIGGMTKLIDHMIVAFEGDAMRLARKGRRPLEDLLVFRIHWGGDFYSLPYARAWSRVIKAHPEVAFWAYTRSFQPGLNVVPILAPLPNLVLYLSVDADNNQRADTVLRRYPAAKAAVLVDEWDQGLSVLSSINRPPAPHCPELTGRTPLVTTLSRRGNLVLGDDGQGACTACGLCIKGQRDVVFANKRG